MKSEFLKPKTTSLPSAADEAESPKIDERRDSRLLAMPHLDHAASSADPRLESLAREMLIELGEDPEREGLIRTPHRVAKSLRFLTSGSEKEPADVLNGALFDADEYSEMVLVKEIEFYSLCEHHLLPFFGTVSVAYLPGGKVVGLSKIPRLVDLFARRLQLQERLTKQIAGSLQQLLEPRGVAVTATAFHLCMAMRGVAKQQSVTTTRAFTGEFLSNPQLRKEFLDEAGRDSDGGK